MNLDEEKERANTAKAASRQVFLPPSQAYLDDERDAYEDDNFWEARGPDEREPLDPLMEAINQRWEEFSELEDYEAQIALFEKTLEEAELMDDDMAYDMLEAIYEAGKTRGHDGRFLGLLDALRERLPEIYADSASFYLELRIEHAIATGQTDKIALPAGDLDNISDDIDIIFRISDLLAYHGLLMPLLEIMRAAWSQARNSKKNPPPSADEIRVGTEYFEIFAALEQGLSLENDEAEIRQRLSAYSAASAENITRYIECLTGNHPKAWTRDDFILHKERWVNGNPVQQAVFFLSVEFIGDLRRKQDVPYTKGYLAQQALLTYLLGRYMDKFDEEEDAYNKHPKLRATSADGLCPDSASLEDYLGGLLGLFPQEHRTAALMEYLPSWLRFLEARGLIDAAQHEAALHPLRALFSEIMEEYENTDSPVVTGIRNSGLLPDESLS